MYLRTPLLALSLAGSYLPFAHGLPTFDNLLKVTGNTEPSELTPDKRAALDEFQKDFNARLDKRLLVDPMTTPVDVTGDHAFHAPGENDQRGPCPGLNALANHGYISRDGVTSLVEVVPAINEVYGMGVELALVLAIMGVVWTGDPLSLNPSFSIGKNTTKVENLLDNLGGLLSQPSGLVGSHNFIESDSSLTRDDLYVTGNNYALNMTKFQTWYDMADENGTYTMDIMGQRASDRFHESIYENPYFYYGPFTGMVARNAGYLFVGRCFANHSSAHPDGVLTKDIVKSFFAISGDEGNFTYNEGYEQIPDNWYKVPVDYGLVQLNLDTIDWVVKYPALGSIGGNTGTPNSFTGVELDNLTDGVLNLPTLLENNNLLCFLLQLVKMASPSYLANFYSTLSVPLSLLLDNLATPLLDLECPEWKDVTYGGKPVWEALGEQFPGANRSASAL